MSEEKADIIKAALLIHDYCHEHLSGRNGGCKTCPLSNFRMWNESMNGCSVSRPANWTIHIRETPGGGMISKRVYIPVRPLPCIRDEHGEIREQTVKALVAKVDEELNELKEEIYSHLGHYGYSGDNSAKELAEEAEFPPMPPMVAEEAADTITAITTMLEALGIYEEIRDDAQRRVNQKNMERGRL